MKSNAPETRRLHRVGDCPVTRNHGDRKRFVHPANFGECFEAVGARHLDVEHHHAVLSLLRGICQQVDRHDGTQQIRCLRAELCTGQQPRRSFAVLECHELLITMVLPSGCQRRGQHRFLAAIPEHVLAGIPEQLTCRGTSPRHQVAQAAYDCHGTAAQLPLHQVGGRGYLIGDGHGRDLELVTVSVPCAGIVFEGPHPGDADGVVRLAQPPGSPSGVGDDHSQPEPVRGQPLPELRRAPVRIARQEQDQFGRKVRPIDAGRGERQTVVGTDNARLTTPGKGSPCLGADHLGTP